VNAQSIKLFIAGLLLLAALPATAAAKEHLGRAVAADARNHLAHYYYAHALSRGGMSETGLVGRYTQQAANER
jgi:hypothetical protein